MAKYIAQVLILVDADSAVGATDAVTAALSGKLVAGKYIVGWSYQKDGDCYLYPRRVDWNNVQPLEVLYDAAADRASHLK